MRILHIITGLGNGGAEATLFRLTGDGENAHHVVSLTDRGVFGDRLTASGVPVHALDMPRGRVTLKGLAALRRLIRGVDPDLVQTWMHHANFLGGLTARSAGKQVVVWGIRSTTLDPETTPWTTRRIEKLCAWLSRWVPRRVVSCSHVAARQCIEMGYVPEKMVVVPNGYDLTGLAPSAAARDLIRAELGVSGTVALLGMVARWNPQKDHASLIAALGQVAAARPDGWRCVLAGSGVTNTNRPLVELLERSGLRHRVALLGPRDDIVGIMNALDVHLLSSAWGEAFPNVVAEAMACGTPCVVTDVGDASLIVGGSGWVVPHSDPSALAAAVLDALSELPNAIVWEKRRAACRSRIADNYTLQQMLMSYRQVWREAIDG